VKTPALAMEQVYSLSKALYYGAIDVQAAARQARAIRDQIATRRAQASGPAADALTTLDRTIEALVGTPAAGGDTLSAVGGGLAGVMNSLQGADVRPTTVQVTAIARARAAAARAMAKWAAIRSVDVPAANTKLTAAGVAAITF
jgi:hypothetical protein